MASRLPARNTKFGFQQNGEKDSNNVHPSIFKQARKSGQLNLSGRSLTKGCLLSVLQVLSWSPKLCKKCRSTVPVLFCSVLVYTSGNYTEHFHLG